MQVQCSAVFTSYYYWYIEGHKFSQIRVYSLLYSETRTSKVSWFGGVKETKKKKEIMNQRVSQENRRYPWTPHFYYFFTQEKLQYRKLQCSPLYFQSFCLLHSIIPKKTRKRWNMCVTVCAVHLYECAHVSLLVCLFEKWWSTRKENGMCFLLVMMVDYDYCFLEM